MTQEQNEVFGDVVAASSLKERLFKYVSKWPLFMAFIILSVGAGILYIRYTPPKYLASASFLIKGNDEGKPYTDDLIESALNGKGEINLNNEILLFNAASLMERTVAANNFNISYFKKGRILTTDIYTDAPFTLTAKKLSDSTRTYNIYIKNTNSKGGTFSTGLNNGEKLQAFRWNQSFPVNGQEFVLSPKSKVLKTDGDYIVVWEPISTTAEKFSQHLSVKAYDTKTSVIKISVKTGNLQKGVDLLNALFNEFNKTDKEERIKLSTSTIGFIDDRLLAISGELKGVEGNLENYQGSKQLIDIKGQSTQSLGNLNDVSKTIKDLAIQQGVTSMILDYFANPSSSNKLVPSSMGLNDGTLASLITQFNELQLKKERVAPSVTANSTVMLDLNTQLGNLKSSILESLASINRNLKLQENNFRQQNSQYQDFLSTVPHSERVLQEIKRKQSITEGLYLYLLQKREEAAISSTAANVSHYKQIDPAKGYGPVEPNAVSILIYTFLLGFCLALAWIYFRSLLNDTITSKEDIVKRTLLPVVGQIGHFKRKKILPVPVLDRNVISEQFRAIRTSLSFLMKEKKEKVILVTSSVSNEGKSFVSLNLAAVLAMPGKKVALLQFDIRQPNSRSIINPDSDKGLTNYLSGELDTVSDIIQYFEPIPYLHIYPPGTIPLHAADLLLSDKMETLFEKLKNDYDYIVMDSAPVGMVSDAFTLGKFSDLVLYVVRNRKTLKKQLDFATNAATNKSFNNVALILNDIKKIEEYGYDYGKNYKSIHSNGHMIKNEKVTLVS